ncbi:MAG: hypothetical protein AAB592_05750, partial [Patescibacteria group bacterium]
MSTATIIDRYTRILNALDAKTAELQKKLPEIPCKNKCFNCCEQLFPITFLEAYHISRLVQQMNHTERVARTEYATTTNER